MLKQNPLPTIVGRRRQGMASNETTESSAPFATDVKYLTTLEAGALLRVSKSYLDKLRVYGGGPPFRRFGRKILYLKSDLETWANERRFGSTSEYR